MSTVHQAACCIVGGGPAGMVLGLLLGRAGVDVVVLEKHKDFLRDFRGDTIHPATLEILHELGLLEDFLSLPHQKIAGMTGVLGGEVYPISDLSHLPTVARYIALMPQWDFLDFLAQHARRHPSFRLLMEHEVTALIHEDGRAVGVRATTPSGPVEVRAPLTVGCDGRHAVSRAAGHLEVIDEGVPIDVLWFRLSRRPADPENALGYVDLGTFSVLIDRGDYFQVAFIIRKGDFPAVQARGLAAFRDQLARLVPFLAEPGPDGRSRVDELTDFSQLKLLTVQLNHLRSWHAPGLLCIGDAAHAMSPVGGVGINIAIQDAVAAANLLAVPLLHATLARPVPEDTLAQVQRRRAPAARITQFVQAQAHGLLMRMLGKPGHVQVPPLLRALTAQPLFRRFMGRAVGMGVLPEHVRSPAAR